MKFPQNFIRGAAASSYQIEGAACSDGGGHPIGDMPGRQQGRIIGGDTGEIACNQYSAIAKTSV
ncbi:MAG: family 1 glycosylhydrolase [Gammaproteobacteria bacterium]|nr:family 1 glycosylhydrolase [Gammaproteobacteria bacterium]